MRVVVKHPFRSLSCSELYCNWGIVMVRNESMYPNYRNILWSDCPWSLYDKEKNCVGRDFYLAVRFEEDFVNMSVSSFNRYVESRIIDFEQLSKYLLTEE
jgi:hypothetical protein